MNRISINVMTGEKTIIPLTQAEIDALPPLPTEAELAEVAKQTYIKSVSDALQAEMDKDAQDVGYDNILTACSYAGEPSVVKFQDESKSFLKHRSKVWEYAYSVLEQYEADLVQYEIDANSYLIAEEEYIIYLAQYEIEINIEPPIIPVPTKPDLPIPPIEIVAPTVAAIVAGMPVRV